MLNIFLCFLVTLDTCKYSENKAYFSASTVIKLFLYLGDVLERRKSDSV